MTRHWETGEIALLHGSVCFYCYLSMVGLVHLGF